MGNELSQTIAFNGDPLWRWKSIHQSFFLLIQGIVIATQRYSDARAEGRDEAARVELQRIDRLLRASAAAMRLAGSMSTQQYQDVVRPDMMGDDLPPGFSGVLGFDHFVMVKALGALRSALEHHPEEHARIKVAIDYCYDAHVRVCERAEPTGVSLLAGEHDKPEGGVNDLRPGGHYRARTHAKIQPADVIN